MNYKDYHQYCERVLAASAPVAPYTDPMYLKYAKLNVSRMNRWSKELVLNEELVNIVRAISFPQSWIMIAEPWCGDAAPAIPFIVQLAELNPLIQYEIHLRDQEPFLINQYLTNGAKSIPKFIVRDHSGNDVFVWGPRPVLAQDLVQTLKAENADMEKIATQLQHWYNTDKGAAMQHEFIHHFKSYSFDT